MRADEDGPKFARDDEVEFVSAGKHRRGVIWIVDCRHGTERFYGGSSWSYDIWTGEALWKHIPECCVIACDDLDIVGSD